jgi:hypothetical protein
MERESVAPAGTSEAEERGQQAAHLERLFSTPARLVEAIIAAEVLAPPLALRTGPTAFDRRTF